LKADEVKDALLEERKNDNWLFSHGIGHKTNVYQTWPPNKLSDTRNIIAGRDTETYSDTPSLSLCDCVCVVRVCMRVCEWSFCVIK